MHFDLNVRRVLFSAASCGLLTAVATAATSQVATAIAEPQVKTSEKFGRPMSEAVGLVKDRKYPDALVKVEQAAPFAKTQTERLGVEQMRTAIYNGLGRQPDLIKSLEAQLAIGGLPAATVKAHRLTLAGLYSKQKNDTKAAALTRSYIEDYGGKPEQYAFVASYELDHKHYADALKFAAKAITDERASGGKPPEKWRQILIRAEFERGNLPGYYAAVEQAAGDYPKPEYLRILIERAIKEPRFSNAEHRLDVYRALDTAGVPLTPEERADMGERAYSRGLPSEAAAALAPLTKSGFKGIDGSRVDRFKKMQAQILVDAKDEMERLSASAKRAGRGEAFVTLGEAYSAAGDGKLAIDAIREGLDMGIADPGDEDFARLQLGIAEARAGEDEAARQTWNSIQADNGAAVLARAWALMSRTNLV